MPGCFAEATLDDVRSYPWPDPADFDYTELLREIRAHGDKAVFSGSLGTFFHDMCDFFGMEEYFIRMYTDPQVVHAATDRLVDFYVEANDRFFREAGDSFDIFLIVNDFGTQRDLFMSLEQFRTFILPGFKRLIEVGKKYGKTIMLHSCGSIYRVIPDLIDAGVDILHPIQAMAAPYGRRDPCARIRARSRLLRRGGHAGQARQLVARADPRGGAAPARRVRRQPDRQRKP